MTVAVREEQVITALRKLDRKRWAEVLNFIGYLQIEAEQPKAVNQLAPMMGTDLLTSGLVGLWADRTDINDSPAFARNLRQNAEHHRSERNVTA